MIFLVLFCAFCDILCCFVLKVKMDMLNHVETCGYMEPFKNMFHSMLQIYNYTDIMYKHIYLYDII